MSIISKEEARKRSDDSAIDCRDWDPDTGEQIFLVREEFAQECDINWILSRHGFAELADRYRDIAPNYGDFSDVMTYGDARMLVVQSDNAFAALPAKIRAMFENDPENLIKFVEDPNNFEECVKLGLLERNVGSAAEKAAEEPAKSSLDVIGGTDDVSGA